MDASGHTFTVISNNIGWHLGWVGEILFHYEKVNFNGWIKWRVHSYHTFGFVMGLPSPWFHNKVLSALGKGYQYCICGVAMQVATAATCPW